MKTPLLIILTIFMILIIEWQILGVQAHNKELRCKQQQSAYEYYYCEGR